MPRIELTELERMKLAKAGADSIPCTHGWQPIETAPKDGRSVLVADAKYKTIGINFWCNYENDWDRESDLVWPTHWMPLPEPPQDELK